MDQITNNSTWGVLKRTWKIYPITFAVSMVLVFIGARFFLTKNMTPVSQIEVSISKNSNFSIEQMEFSYHAVESSLIQNEIPLEPNDVINNINYYQNSSDLVFHYFVFYWQDRPASVSYDKGQEFLMDLFDYLLTDFLFLQFDNYVLKSNIDDIYFMSDLFMIAQESLDLLQLDISNSDFNFENVAYKNLNEIKRQLLIIENQYALARTKRSLDYVESQIEYYNNLYLEQDNNENQYLIAGLEAQKIDLNNQLSSQFLSDIDIGEIKNIEQVADNLMALISDVTDIAAHYYDFEYFCNNNIPSVQIYTPSSLKFNNPVVLLIIAAAGSFVITFFAAFLVVGYIMAKESRRAYP